MLGQILNQGYVKLRKQAHLVEVGKLDTTKDGETFLRCVGVSPDADGQLVTKLVVNVFPSVSMLSRMKEITKACGLVLVFGELTISDTDYGNETRAISNAQLATFGPDGKFSLDGGTMTGEPGGAVIIPVSTEATLKTLETVVDRAPNRKTVELKARHSARRTMGKAAPDADTQADPAAVPVGATTTA